MGSTTIRDLGGRVAVAVLLVLLAAGTTFAAATSLTTATRPAFAGPGATESPEAKESPEASEAPEATEAPEASETPDADESPRSVMLPATPAADATPSPANLARIVGLLATAGITTTTDQLAALAKVVGVGGAVRVLRFADASGKTPDQIVAMFRAGTGWGQIARDLKLDIGPGNGSVMSGGHGKAGKAHGKGNAKPAGGTH